MGRAHHRPHRPDSLGHRPGRRIAHRSGRRHAPVARRGQPVRPNHGPAAADSVQAGPATTVIGQAHAPARRKLLSSAHHPPEPPGPRQANRARRRNPHSAAATPAHQRHPVQTSPADPAAGSRAGPYSPHPGGLLTATPSPAERRDRLMEKAILLAVTASLCTATSSVYQRKGARSSPAAGFDLRVVFRLARQPVWLLGIAGMILGLVFQLTALRFGELALVQPVLAAGLLFVFGLPGRGRLAAGQATRLAGRGRDGGRDRRLPLPRVARVARPECRDAAPSGEPDPGTGRPKCRAASGKAARRSVLLPCRGDMPARKRPIPRGCRDRPPGPARRARP